MTGAAAGADGDDADRLGWLQGVTERCGAVAEHVERERAWLSMRLIDALDVAAAEVDNLCVINATLILFMTDRTAPGRLIVACSCADGHHSQSLTAPSAADRVVGDADAAAAAAAAEQPQQGLCPFVRRVSLASTDKDSRLPLTSPRLPSGAGDAGQVRGRPRAGGQARLAGPPPPPLCPPPLCPLPACLRPQLTNRTEWSSPLIGHRRQVHFGGQLAFWDEYYGGQVPPPNSACECPRPARRPLMLLLIVWVAGWRLRSRQTGATWSSPLGSPLRSA